jgi:hypothetical protein
MRNGLITKTTLNLGFLIIIQLCLTNCVGKFSKAKNIAETAGLKSKVLHTSKFKIQTFYRFSKKGAPLTVYIEGDGLAWLNRNQPSINPTPRNPLALRLAALDEGVNVLYLARPCQYVDLYTEQLCSIPYWTNKRFAREVIMSIDEAINIMTSKIRSKKIHMIGYSGGGAIVAIVAARRKDIASIRTVAGYMDHVTLNRKVNVSQLTGSLDPIKAAPKLKKVPQIHYSGRTDKTMPGWVLRNFRKAVGSRNCITLKRVDAGHEEGWEEVWKDIWYKMPTCRK